MKDKKIILLDIESTGKDEEDRLCEVAYKKYGAAQITCGRFKPPLPVKFEAMAVHHITNEMLRGGPSFASSQTYCILRDWFHVEERILVAHNAKFDIGMLEREGMNVPNFICTMKVMRDFDKKEECSNYKMQYLRYKLNLNPPDTRVQSHNATDDVVVLELLFEFLLKEGYTVEKMIKISTNPQLMRSLPFGKHKGIPCKDVPYSYWTWLRQQSSIDEDLRHTINYHIKRLTS